jgi:hypothetical protein
VKEIHETNQNLNEMAATKDQRKLLKRCIENEIPVFVLTGTDACAMTALMAYAAEARSVGCSKDFIQDLETNVIPDFRDFQNQEPEKVKKPD